MKHRSKNQISGFNLSRFCRFECCRHTKFGKILIFTIYFIDSKNLLTCPFSSVNKVGHLYLRHLFPSGCCRRGFGWVHKFHFADELVLHAWIFSTGSSAHILSVFCCVRLSRNENRHYKIVVLQVFLRRFPRVEKRVPRIRENRVPTSQTNRVPKGPCRVPNIFL